MTVIQRVSNIDSNSTQLNSDYDFSAYQGWLSNNASWIMFSDMTAKPEFLLNANSWTITAGRAIIACTRTWTSPIPNKKAQVVFELSDTLTLIGNTSWTKIYVEIDNNLVQNPTLIQDTYPASDYAKWLNIWSIKNTLTRPTHPNYIKLWENVAWVWYDRRTTPKLLANRMDFIDADWNFSTESNITWYDIQAIRSFVWQAFVSPIWDIQSQINTLNTSLVPPPALVDNTYMLWEAITDITKSCLFLEWLPTFALSTNKWNIWDVVWNTRIDIPVLSTWIFSSTFNIWICKTLSPSVNLKFQLENDDWNWNSNWTLVNANATAQIAPWSLTTSPADTTITRAWTFTAPAKWTIMHLVMYVWTYGSETVNSSNYYCVSFSENNSTSRWINMWNWSNWITATPQYIWTKFKQIAYTTDSNSYGIRFSVSVNTPLIWVSRSSLNTQTTCVLKNTWWTILQTGIVWTNSAFFNYMLTAWTDYIIERSWTNKISTRFNLTTVWITYPFTIWNITFKYSTQNTSDYSATVFMNILWIWLWRWFFPYISSALFQNQVLSLANSDLIYKTNVYWISSELKAVGTYPKVIMQWLSRTWSGLTIWRTYFLYWMWWISLSWWLYMTPIWEAISLTDINKKSSPLYSLPYTTLDVTQNPSWTTYSSSYQPTATEDILMTFNTNSTSGWSSDAWIQYSYDWTTNRITIFSIPTSNGGAISTTTWITLIKWMYYRTYWSQSYTWQASCKLQLSTQYT